MRIWLIFVGLALAGCAQNTQYIRADGQAVSQEQAEADRTACAAESDDKLCMVAKGYFLVDKDQAAAKSAQLAAIAEEQRKQAELAAKEEAKRKAAEKKKRKRTAARPATKPGIDPAWDARAKVAHP